MDFTDHTNRLTIKNDFSHPARNKGRVLSRRRLKLSAERLGEYLQTPPRRFSPQK